MASRIAADCDRNLVFGSVRTQRESPDRESVRTTRACCVIVYWTPGRLSGMSNPNPSPRTRFQPGRSGNPKGRPKLPPLSAWIANFFKHGNLADLQPKATDTPLDLFAKMVLTRAFGGEFPYVKMVFDRSDGRVTNWAQMDEYNRFVEDALEDDKRVPELVSTGTSELETVTRIAAMTPATSGDPGPVSVSNAIKSRHESLVPGTGKFPSETPTGFPVPRKGNDDAPENDGQVRIAEDSRTSEAPSSATAPSATRSTRLVQIQAAEASAPRAPLKPSIRERAAQSYDSFPVTRKADSTDNAVVPPFVGAGPSGAGGASSAIDPGRVPTAPAASFSGALAGSNGSSLLSGRFRSAAIPTSNSIPRDGGSSSPSQYEKRDTALARRQRRGAQRKARKAARTSR
jgi:hypothetical protein